MLEYEKIELSESELESIIREHPRLNPVCDLWRLREKPEEVL